MTISVHLIVLIIFLIYSIQYTIRSESSFVLDFTKQEELEKEIEITAMKESVSKELDELIAQARTKTPRNVVVDASSLKDDRNKKPNDIYNQAKKLQEKLNASKRAAEAASDDSQNIPTNSSEQNTKEESYKGPSVISYTLKGRKSMSLPIPAYKCMSGGDVSVAIIVNQKGYVVSVRIIDEVSSNDDCLRDYAMKAAKQSRFTASSTANDREAGEIVYRFVEQ